MASNKRKETADNVAIRKANEAALKCFPKRELRKALDALAETRGKAEDAQITSDNVSLDIVAIAEVYASEARTVTDDVTTVLADWRDNMAVMCTEMAIAGHKFAKLNKGKDGKPDTAVLTGTGNNVLSIAKGVIDFSVMLDSIDTGDTPLSYRNVRETVQGLRKARKDAANPEAALLAEAEQNCREAFVELCGLVFGQKDIELTEALTAALDSLVAEEKTNMSQANAIEAEIADKIAKAV